MKLFKTGVFLFLMTVFLAGIAPPASAGPAPEGSPKNFDRRHDPKGLPSVRPTAEQDQAASRLRSRVPDLDVDFDPLIGAPKILQSRRSFLTGPSGSGGTVTRDTLREFDPQDRDRPVKALLHEHRQLFGHGPEVLLPARRLRDYVTPHNQMRTVVWKQQFDGIPLYETVMIAHLTAEEELVNVSSQFLPNPEQAARAGAPGPRLWNRQPPLDAQKALMIALEAIDETVAPDQVVLLQAPSNGAEQHHEFIVTGLPGQATASLVWLPLDRHRLRLCWWVEANRRERGERFRVLVDAIDQTIHLRRGLTFDLSDVTYRVFTGASPSPFAPSHSVPSRVQPPLVPRSLVTLGAWNTNASPLGWIHPGINEIRGNNVDAYLDRDGNNRPDLPRPQLMPGRVLDFPLDLSQSPDTYGDAAVVQLFYWCNWIHDRLYELGFTEGAGNFQKDNFGRGGLGGDPMLAEAQDGSGFNNANFTPSRDGTSGRIQMFLFDGADPFRDSSFDAEVILHEYTHGLSDRLVGGGVGISSGDQPFGLAEGWSDFYALALLAGPDDDPDAPYAYGGYMAHGYNGLMDNYYFGIRRYPYSTDLLKNPLTFQHIYGDDAVQHPGIPRNPIIISTGKASHRMGEVWCVTLWEARANLIRKHGFSAGNELMLRLVTDGMKLSPPNPDFLQARDAILKADQINSGGADRHELWAAFAKRGMGLGARTSDHWLNGGWAIEAFDTPDSLVIDRAAGTISGPPGGPFSPDTQNVTLSNTGPEEILWTAHTANDWLEVVPASGGIPPGESAILTVVLAPSATLLPSGVHANTVTIVNTATSRQAQMHITFKIGQPDWLTEVFDGRDFDLERVSVTFTPDESPDFYTVCLTPAFEFPTDPDGGIPVRVADDSYEAITLASPAAVSLFDTRTNQLFIGSNGDIVFSLPETYTYDPARGIHTNFFYPGVNTFLERLRIAPLYGDLNPEDGGTITWKALADRVAVTYLNVPEYGVFNRNSFQVELFYNGVVRFTYLETAIASSIAGLSRGTGAGGFLESDLSASGGCYPALRLALPASATEGGPTAQGVASLNRPAENDLQIHLQSSHPLAAWVESFVIPEGQSAGSFPITFPEDQLLNGTRRAVITAYTDEHDAASATIDIFDNEFATLNLALPSSAVTGDRVRWERGTVHVHPPPDETVAVRLISSHPEIASAPAEVHMQAGQSSAPFNLTIREAAAFHPPIPATIEAVVENWETGTAVVEIIDGKSRELKLRQVPEDALENAGTLSTSLGIVGPDGTVLTNIVETNVSYVEIAATLPTNLVVHLSVDRPDTLVPSETTTIPAGERFGWFGMTLLDNELSDGHRTVILSATAPGFVEGMASILVWDDETPFPPIQPSPPDGAVDHPTSLVLSWQTARPQSNSVTYQVLFGTNAAPGSGSLLAQTTSRTAAVSNLPLDTTFYWQVIVTRDGTSIAGPVWEFTTTGLGSFHVAATPSPQFIGTPFHVTVTAIDKTGATAASFNGPAALSGTASAPISASLVISEVDSGNPAQAEFANVSGRDLEISGWEITFYDWVTWPEPRTVFTVPSRTLARAGEVFTVRRFAPQLAGGEYPAFAAPGMISWNNIGTGNPIAILLRDAEGNVVDFFCAVDAHPEEISTPIPIPAEHWEGQPVPPKFSTTLSYQRRGNRDRNNASDWITAAANLASWNPELSVPFEESRPVHLSPATLDGFVDGIWTGFVTVHDIAERMVLSVQDAHGVSGDGTPFSAHAPDDLSVKLNAPPSIPRVGALFTYTMIVSNSGPSTATAVTLTNRIAGAAQLVAATTSQGGFALFADHAVFDLGPIHGGNHAVATLAVQPTATGTLASEAAVSRGEPDFHPANNHDTDTRHIDYLWLGISSARVTEGNTTTNALFTVRLSDAAAETVTFEYYTADHTAMAGSDYIETAGVLEFPPGTVVRTIPVTVLGDTISELTETFEVHLRNPINAIVAQSPGVGTIIDDDFFAGVPVTISDVAILEGDSGVSEARFAVSLLYPGHRPVTVFYETINGTATAGLDYLSAHGSLTFAVGETNKTITVGVLGDTVVEANETFLVRLTAASNASLSQGQATGTIIDDDAWRHQRFAWTLPQAPQLFGAPFPAAVNAVTGAGQIAASFGGIVTLQAGKDWQETTIGTTPNLSWEFPFAAAFHDARLQVIYPAGEIGRYGRITALSLDLTALPGQVLRHWTIRMKHSPSDFHQAPHWEETGWTTVYQADETLVAPGWTTFHFQTPFHFNGADHLMVDFSFHNAFGSRNGMVRSTASTEVRALGFTTDNGFGDPLGWTSANAPPPAAFKKFPNTRFSIDVPIAITPEASGTFLDGIWNGSIQILDAGTNVRLLARDSAGRVGMSDPFHVSHLDSDGDGMPDQWETAHGFNPHDPRDAFVDSDGDGMTNLEEFLAGTDPLDPESVLRISWVEVEHLSLRLAFPTVAGRRYQLESSAALASGVWIPASGVITGDGADCVLILTIETATLQFYRIQLVP